MLNHKKLLNYENGLKNIDKNIATHIKKLRELQDEAEYTTAKLTYAFEQKHQILDRLSSFSDKNKQKD